MHARLDRGELMQKVDLPAEHGPVDEYLKRLQSRQSWQNTFYGEDLVNEGWRAHISGKSD